MKTRSIQFQTIFPAEPGKVYHLLMDQAQHARIAGKDARISAKTDGKFIVWGGYCHGYNIELKEGEKIVQAWHFDETGWPDNHYSICTFTFAPCERGCRMHFEQSEVPEASADTIEKGWKTFYWDKMMALLEKQ